VGTDLIAALSVHPVEVAEAHDRSELHRVADGPPALLVVVVDPPDARAVVVETSVDLPGVPILLVSDSAGSFAAGEAPFRGVVDTIRSGQPLPDLCWHVLEAVSRAIRLPGIIEHPLGPDLIEVDQGGIVVTGATRPGGVIIGGCRLRSGD
jgi:hypothetical protein